MLCNCALFPEKGQLTNGLGHVDQSSKHHTACIVLLSNRFGSRYGPMTEPLISNYGFLVVFDHTGWFGHGFINCLVSDPFHTKLIICEKMSLVLCHTDNPRFSIIMYFIEHFIRLYMSRTSLTNLEESLWLDAFGIFHNNGSLLELRRGSISSNIICKTVTLLYSWV